MRQAEHVAALRSGQTAARLADEDDDRAVGFLNGDRMTQAIVGGIALGNELRLGMLAGAQHHGKTGKRSRHAEGAAAIEG